MVDVEKEAEQQAERARHAWQPGNLRLLDDFGDEAFGEGPAGHDTGPTPKKQRTSPRQSQGGRPAVPREEAPVGKRPRVLDGISSNSPANHGEAPAGLKQDGREKKIWSVKGKKKKKKRGHKRKRRSSSSSSSSSGSSGSSGLRLSSGREQDSSAVQSKEKPGALLKAGLKQVRRFLLDNPGAGLAVDNLRESWRETKVGAYVSQVLFVNHPPE